MSSSTAREDLRSIKIKKALYTAMFPLLIKLNFRKITIKAICEEALISRATFYAHFVDKYDLLKHWIKELWLKDFNCNDTYEYIENAVNSHIQENMSVIKNIVDDADKETFDILFDCILSTTNLNIEKNTDKEMYSNHIVLSHFYAGGILSYLSWQVENKFSSDVPPMNRYLYEMMHAFQNWQ